MRDPRQPQIIAGRVNADGSIAAGDGFTILKGGAGSGIYTITFTGGFRLVSITGSSGAGNVRVVSFSSFTTNSVVAGNFTSSTLAAADDAFTFIAAGVQQ